MLPENLPPRQVPEDPASVQDLIELFNVLNRTKGALDIFIGLRDAGMFKKRISRFKALDVIEAALEENKEEFFRDMAPTLRESLGETILPFPKHHKN